MDVTEVRQNRWFRRVAAVAGGAMALWAVTWLAVPPLVRSQLEKLATEQLGRKLTLGAVDFKPWSLELTLHDLAAAPVPMVLPTHLPSSLSNASI